MLFELRSRMQTLDSLVVNFPYSYFLLHFPSLPLFSSILSPPFFSSASVVGQADIPHGTTGVKPVGSESWHFFEEGLFLGPTQITGFLLLLSLGSHFEDSFAVRSSLLPAHMSPPLIPWRAGSLPCIFVTPLPPLLHNPFQVVFNHLWMWILTHIFCILTYTCSACYHQAEHRHTTGKHHQ